jgi:LPXTG-motif cell wall-anchored protein
MKPRRIVLSALVATFAALVVTPGAFAQDPTSEIYPPLSPPPLVTPPTQQGAIPPPPPPIGGGTSIGGGGQAEEEAPVQVSSGGGTAPGGASGGGTTPLTAEAQPGDLPFTGADLTFFVLVGAALVGSGLLLRRAARKRV